MEPGVPNFFKVIIIYIFRELKKEISIFNHKITKNMPRRCTRLLHTSDNVTWPNLTAQTCSSIQKYNMNATFVAAMKNRKKKMSLWSSSKPNTTFISTGKPRQTEEIILIELTNFQNFLIPKVGKKQSHF